MAAGVLREVGGIGIDWDGHGFVVFGSFAAGVGIVVLLWFGARFLARGGHSRAARAAALVCFLVAAAGLAAVALALSP